MSAFNYEELSRHIGHKINCVQYGNGQNVALECEDCNEVLLDYDRPDPEDRKLEYLSEDQLGDIDHVLQDLNMDRESQGLSKIKLTADQKILIIDKINKFDYHEYNNQIRECIEQVVL